MAHRDEPADRGNRSKQSSPPPRRKRKVFRWVVLTVLVLLVAAGVVVYVNLNRIVKHAVETQGSKSLNLATTLDGASVSLFGGALGLDGLRIAQPQGFSGEHLMTLDDLDVKVSLGELRGEPIRIGSITVNRPRLVIENQGGTLNIKRMVDNLPKGEPSTGESKPMKLVINELKLQEAVVLIKPGIPGLPPELTVNIPSFTMKNIGQGEGSDNGAAIKDVVTQIVTAMAAQAKTSDLVPPELRALLQGNLDGIVAQLGGEARKRIAESLPPEARTAISALESLQRGEAPNIPGLNLPGGSTSQPARIPIPSEVQDAAKKLPDLGGLLDGKKDDKKR